MYYYLVQLVIYIIFIVASRSMASEEIKNRATAFSALFGLVFLAVSYLVELPMILVPSTALFSNKWLYLSLALVIALVKITIPFCAILAMSGFFKNTKINKIVLLIAAVMLILTMGMNAYETRRFFKWYENFSLGQNDFLFMIAGGPTSFNFGRLHLVVRFIPAIAQMIVCLVGGDNVSADVERG